MNSRITKYAVATALIIAIFVGMKLAGGSIDGTTVVWAQVVEQVSNHTRYKCRQRIVREQGPQIPARKVYHLNLSQRRQEHEDGIIAIIDMRGQDAITVELNPATKKATVTNLIGIGPRKDPHIARMVKQFEQESTERLGTKKLNGKTVHGFRHQPNKYSEFTVWIDPKTKLPVEMEIKHLNRGQTIFMDEFEFDFELDPPAFSTDVPDGYEVKIQNHHYRPVEPGEVTAEEIRSALSHPAYAIGKLPWIEKSIMIQAVDPLGARVKIYMTGIATDDGNTIVLAQGEFYDGARMVWIPEQQLVLETPGGAKLYTHPNGSEYALAFLKSFAEANPEFLEIEDLSEERFARMIVMPDETIMGLSANNKMSEKKLEELVESLTEIKE